MKHLILGYGYCGYYLAQELLKQRHRVWTLSRNIKDDYLLDGVTHLQGDLFSNFCFSESVSVIHYLIPPQSAGKNDERIKQWLDSNTIQTKKIVYYGSSGVYGDQNGELTDENTPCILEFDRQHRRLDAERLLTAYGDAHNIPVLLLRIAGIMGPDRLPIQAILDKQSVIKVSEAPWSNTIYVKDLVKIALLAVNKIKKTSIYNVSDGIPTPMGSTQRLLAILMQLNRIYEKSFSEIYDEASEFKREFLMSSKKLSIDKLKKLLKSELELTEKVNAIKESLMIMEQADLKGVLKVV